MKLIQGIVHLSMTDLEQAGLQRATLVKACSRNALVFIKDPQDARKTIFSWPELPERYKDKVVIEFGDPEQYIRHQGLKDQVKDSVDAFDFYSTYKLQDGTGLPVKHIADYTTAASWLVFLTTNKWTDLGFVKAPDFYDAIARVMKEEGVKLPGNYAKLKRKMKAFEKNGFRSIAS